MTGFAKELPMFKSQLQEYAQKAGLPAPVYDTTKEGPSHEPQFKASVTVQGETYESPAFFGNLKKAEHAAAEVALVALATKSDPSTAFPGPLHESGLCKNLLQEYAQKCKLPLPVYSLVKSGETHSPSFSATVEIAGVQYKGGVCKSKKEAEIKAAKTALIAIFSDPGGSSLQAFENQLPSVSQHGTASASVRSSSAKSNSGTKRKKRPRGPQAGNKDRRKMKLNDGHFVKVDESANGDAQLAGNDADPASGQVDNLEQTDGSPSLLSGSAEIPGITTSMPKLPKEEPLCLHVDPSTVENSKIASETLQGCTPASPNRSEQPVQSPHAQGQ